MKTQPCCWIHSKDPNAYNELETQLLKIGNFDNDRPLVFLCIGTPALTGDCLGPTIGSLLRIYSNAFVYGTLRQPVHAMNLCWAIDIIKRYHKNAIVVAIDAALGTPEQAGFITIKKGPLRPGEGVGKKLPPVGDVHIKGIFDSLNRENSKKLLIELSQCISAALIHLKY